MKLIAISPTVGKSHPVDSQALTSDQKFSLAKNSNLEILNVEERAGKHIGVKLENKEGIWFFYRPHVKVLELLSYQQLDRCLPHARDVDLQMYFKPINDTLWKFEIDTPHRIAMFLAQIAHESGSLRYKEELATGLAYEGRKDLGNIKPGDGQRYKGRGLIQLTGRHNYRQCGRALGIGLENNPELAETPTNSALIAGWYWHSRGLNKYADLGNYEGLRQTTRRINGGYNGFPDRLQHWGRAKGVLGIK